MQNISAVLAEMGRPWIEGYKPAENVGPTNRRKIRQLIEGDDEPLTTSWSGEALARVEPRRVYVANFGRENLYWTQCLEGSHVATMQDERAHAYWEDGDRDGFIKFAISTLKTAKGLPPTTPVASRWFNLGTIVAESENDLWFHRQGDLLWWTVTSPAPVAIDRDRDPTAREGEPEIGVFYRKPARPWSNKTIRGNRLEWRALHPKSHDFFATEATFQGLGPEYAGFAVALVNGDDLSPWTDQKHWREKVAARSGNAGGRVLNRREITIAMMARTALETARNSYGQQELRKVKNKEVRFASQRELEAYLSLLWDSQEGLCSLSGLALQKYPPDDPEFCASLDRIDSDGHYEAGNLQIVCRFINRWKSDDDVTNFRRLLDALQHPAAGAI